jgi:hypothetical protein
MRKARDPSRWMYTMTLSSAVEICKDTQARWVRFCLNFFRLCPMIFLIRDVTVAVKIAL